MYLETNVFLPKQKWGKDFYENWHHISGIYNGRQLRLYIDNKRVATTSFSGNISSTPFPLCIGREAETQDQGEHSRSLVKNGDRRCSSVLIALVKYQYY